MADERDDNNGDRPGTGMQPWRPPRPDSELVRGLPGLLRVGVNSGLKAVSWAVGSTVHFTTDFAKRTANGEPPAAILQEVTKDLRTFAWRALGLHEETDQSGVPESFLSASGASTADDLQTRGENLLRRSADVRVVEEGHPAYARILSELTPDEARILRFLYLDGAQPSIDVKTFRPLGIGSVKVGEGLNMIAEKAGCRHIERIHPYLTNLARLGLIEFSKEQVDNPGRYQLIEAQPKVAVVLKKAGRMPKIVHRSIRLTPFGTEFCKTCLPVQRPFGRNGHRTD